MVEIYRAKDKFTADEIEYPAGSYVIPVAQPYGHYAKTLLERQRYPDLREYPGGPPKRPYDTTAQTLPLLMGVNTAQITAPFEADLEKLERVELPAGKAEPRRKQYLLRPDSNNAFIAVNRLLKAGAQVARSKRPIQDGGLDFPAGTFVIRSANVQDFTALGLNFYGTDLPLSDAVPLRQPRVALYKSHIPVIDEGWTRWLLEQYEFPYTKYLGQGHSRGKSEFAIRRHRNSSSKACPRSLTAFREGRTSKGNRWLRNWPYPPVFPR